MRPARFSHHRLEQLFLAGVVEVQRALGDAGAGRHFFGAGGGKTFFDEQPQCRIEQLLRAGFLASLTLGRSRGHGKKPPPTKGGLSN
jgi:hypothetical protein